MIPVDLELAKAGYLTRWDGKPRLIHGLDRIARDIETAGADVYWHELPGSKAGACLWQERVIILSPWLWRAFPFMVRRVVTEELGHCIVGPSDECARLWQARLYGDTLLPAWMA